MWPSRKPSIRLALLLGWPLTASCDDLQTTGDSAASDVGQMATVRLDTAVRYQTLEGFGASLAYYDNWLVEHPNKDIIYDLVFPRLGLDILRLRNLFQYQSGGFAEPSIEFVSEATKRLGHPPAILMSSWSPPANLKASGNTVCRDDATCTLRREGQQYVYDEFGQYWRDSLDAYARLGIQPTYISIQNEPDFIPPSWEGCRLLESEDSGFASYVLALDAVHDSLADLESSPKIIGPETATIGSGKVQSYAAALNDDAALYGMAHHLYGGGNAAWRDPDGYVPAMRELARQFPDKPLFQTEFAAGSGGQGGFETAWIIHNAMVEENAVAYLHWDLIWQEPSGLVSLEVPWEPETWQTSAGFQLRGQYYALRHFARYTDPGDVRIDAKSSSRAIRASAYESPEGDRLTVVLLNIELEDFEVAVEGDELGSALTYTTTSDAPWQEGTLESGDSVTVPSRSIMTLVFER